MDAVTQPLPALHPATLCARAGVPAQPAAANEPVQPPIVQSAIFRLDGTDDAESLFSGDRPGHAYTRFGNPGLEAADDLLADLERALAAL